MSFKKSKEQLNSEFKLVIDRAHVCGKGAARADNLHKLATQLGYIDAALTGGKLTNKQAAQQVKDLYRAWKETNRAIDLESFCAIIYSMESFMSLAIEVARTSPSRKPVGAVLLRKNKVIATATNHDCKTHPIQAKWAERVGLSEKIYLHAEISAMIKAREDADKIVVVRLGGHSGNELRQARPCKICEAYLRHTSSIKHVYYAEWTNKFSYEYWG